MRITLTVIEGPHQGQVFTFVGQESFVVGRSTKALFRLPKKDKYISRNHFVVEVNPPYCRLMDLGSRNGTYVNNEKVQCTDLSHQDFIRIGRSVLQVRLEGVPEEAEAVDPFTPLPPAMAGTPAKASLQTEPVVDLQDDLPPLAPLDEEPVPAAAEQAAEQLPDAQEPAVFDPPTFQVEGLRAPPHVPVNMPTEQEFHLPPIEELLAAPEDQGELSAEVLSSISMPDTSISAMVAEEPTPPPHCPLCGQLWSPPATSGQSHPRLWCDICAKAMKLLPQFCPGYRLVRELGRGTTGVVYQAVREEDQAIVAVRHLTPEEKMAPKRRQRFLKEIQQLRALRHPGIVPLLDHVEADGQIFLVLEMVRGETAAQALQRAGPFATPRAVTLLCQCLEALECAHAAGVLHREIKPNSILLDRQHGPEQARLMDFGLEWLCQIAHVSRYSLLKGQTETVTWMPPEQVYNCKDVKITADLYALAASFYTLLTRRPLFSGEASVEKLLRHVLEEEPEPLRKFRPDIPLPLADVLHRALSKEPGERYGTAEEFRLALEPFRSGL